VSNTSCQCNPNTTRTSYSERGSIDNSKGRCGFGFGVTANQCPRGPRPALPSRRSSVGRVGSRLVPTRRRCYGDVRGSAHNSPSLFNIGGQSLRRATSAWLIRATLAAASQLRDAGIGLFQHDLRKFAGTLFFAVLQSRGDLPTVPLEDHAANHARDNRILRLRHFQVLPQLRWLELMQRIGFTARCNALHTDLPQDTRRTAFGSECCAVVADDFVLHVAVDEDEGCAPSDLSCFGGELSPLVAWKP